MFEDKTLLSYGCKVLGNNTTTIEDILYPARQFVDELIKQTEAEVVVIESVQFQSNQRTYSKLSMLLGVLLCLFAEREMLYEVVEATKWKSFCGIRGRKREEQKANTIAFVETEFNLAEVSEDEADAIALGYYFANNISIRKGGDN